MKHVLQARFQFGHIWILPERLSYIPGGPNGTLEASIIVRAMPGKGTKFGIQRTGPKRRNGSGDRARHSSLRRWVDPLRRMIGIRATLIRLGAAVIGIGIAGL